MLHTLHEKALVIKALRDGAGDIHSYLLALGEGKLARLPVDEQKRNRKTRQPALLNKGDTVSVCVTYVNPRNGNMVVSEQQAAFRLLLRKLDQKGWKEDFPEPNFWTYRKGHWVCTIYASPLRVVFRSNRPLKKFEVHWLSGVTETMFGSSIADAFKRSGYGGGAASAVDYYKQVTP